MDRKNMQELSMEDMDKVSGGVLQEIPLAKEKADFKNAWRYYELGTPSGDEYNRLYDEWWGNYFTPDAFTFLKQKFNL